MIRHLIGDSGRCAALAMTLAAAVALTAEAARGEVVIEVGQPFPVMAMPSLDDGQPVSVADHRGQKLILHIFAAW